MEHENMCEGVISENLKENMQGNMRYKGQCIHYYVELPSDREKHSRLTSGYE